MVEESVQIWRPKMVGGGGGAVFCVVELRASRGDRRTQRLVQGRLHGGAGLLVSRHPAGSSSRLPWVAFNGGSWWLSRAESLTGVVWLCIYGGNEIHGSYK